MTRADHPLVAVTHPGRQHSHQAALALAEAELLETYVSGVPAHLAPWVFPLSLRHALLRHGRVDVPASKTCWVPTAPMFRAIARTLPGTAGRERLEHLGHRTFDLAAATIVAQRRGRLGAVVCSETAALRTFAVAKARGWTTILDAASVHHETQDALSPSHADGPLTARIRRTKDAEIALADHIFTLSRFARESYLAAGVPAAKLHVLHLGDDAPARAASHPAAGDGGPLRFLYVGSAAPHKGVDLLIDAFRLGAFDGAATLALAGVSLAELERRGGSLPSGVEARGRLDASDLAAAYAAADWVVVPSRFDSFSRVVLEAMRRGTPVVVTETVGAKDLIEHRVNGLVAVSGSVEALLGAMRWCIAHRAELPVIRERASSSVAGNSWAGYRLAFGALVEQLVRRAG